jgi:hypothetical protein
MPRISLRSQEAVLSPTRKRKFTVSYDDFHSVSPKALGIGSIGSSTSFPVVAAVFDLEGFTRFCHGPDPQLAVPRFVNLFTEWLFERLRESSIEPGTIVGPSTVDLTHRLPFFVKFLGDGILVLWESQESALEERQSIIRGAIDIVRCYGWLFPSDTEHFQNMPKRLRCGIAAGNVLSIGEHDFVGPCINLAARLQKLPGVTFAIRAKGIEPWGEDSAIFAGHLVRKSAEIRVNKEREGVYISKDEYDAMPQKTQKKYLSA